MPSVDEILMNFSKGVGNIENYSGGLRISMLGGRYFWAIECKEHSTFWEEIPEDLFEHLERFSGRSEWLPS